MNWLSNRIFKSFDDIVDHCCYAWNRLIDQPWKIMSIAQRATGQQSVTQSEDWYDVVRSPGNGRKGRSTPGPKAGSRGFVRFLL
jgi:hypothetical protein